MPVTAKLGDLLHFQRNVAMYLEIWSKMQLINPNSPLWTFPMAAKYDLISVLRGFGKSAGTLLTCLDPPPMVSYNFNFSVFGYIFEKIQHVFYIITTKSCSKCNRSASKMHKNRVFGKNFVFSKKFK